MSHRLSALGATALLALLLAVASCGKNEVRASRCNKWEQRAKACGAKFERPMAWRCEFAAAKYFKDYWAPRLACAEKQKGCPAFNECHKALVSVKHWAGIRKRWAAAAAQVCAGPTYDFGGELGARPLPPDLQTRCDARRKAAYEKARQQVEAFLAKPSANARVDCGEVRARATAAKIPDAAVAPLCAALDRTYALQRQVGRLRAASKQPATPLGPFAGPCAEGIPKPESLKYAGQRALAQELVKQCFEVAAPAALKGVATQPCEVVAAAVRVYDRQTQALGRAVPAAHQPLLAALRKKLQGFACPKFGPDGKPKPAAMAPGAPGRPAAAMVPRPR